MATKYSGQIQRAQASIKRKGGLVRYTQVAGTMTPNDPSVPFLIGTPVDPDNDPNANAAPVDVYCCFVAAKSIGSEHRGFVSRFSNKTDIAGGDKLALIAGGQGLACKIGDIIDRNINGVTGYPLYKVCDINNVDVDGTVILWELELEI